MRVYTATPPHAPDPPYLADLRAHDTLVGVAICLQLAVALGRLLSVAMFEVSPCDPVVLTLAPLVLVGVAALAAYLPARRGMRVSPLEALRVE